MKKILISTLLLSAFSIGQVMANPTVKSDGEGSTIDYGNGVIEHTRESKKEVEKRLAEEKKNRG